MIQSFLHALITHISVPLRNPLSFFTSLHHYMLGQGACQDSPLVSCRLHQINYGASNPGQNTNGLPFFTSKWCKVESRFSLFSPLG